MTVWDLDTCQCQIDTDGPTLIKKCKLHARDNINDVLAHARSFNFRHGHRELTRDEIEQLSADKAAEKKRIERL